jgi:phenylalanyl-tRNA synthetase alpha chain
MDADSLELELQAIVSEANGQFANCSDAPALANAKARYLGKEGFLTQKMKALGAASPQERAAAGKTLNQAKVAIETALQTRQQAMDVSALSARLSAESIDVSLPGRGQGSGGLHPVSLTIERIESLFQSIGFDIADGPEIEEDYYNFTALNTPENHPARSMHDTFYVEGGLLLRTHTSPMQIRYAKHTQPPIKVIAPGKTYRVDSDATHSPMFHQFEGMWIDRNINFSDLKSVFTNFLRRFFEQDDIEVRFRSSYFPFTEPSAEIDMKFSTGPNKGRWLEVAGSGQVHPQVIRNIGLDPEEYIGFAFGSGVERLAMLRYGVSDLRLFYDNDLRFLRQFSDQEQ